MDEISATINDFARDRSPHVRCDCELCPVPAIVEQWLRRQLPREWST